jgi:hypothetical protein
MTRDEYEERRKRMDKELRAAIELLQAAHAAQVRALDLVWMSSGDHAPAVAPPLGEPMAPGAPPASAKMKRQPIGQLYEDVCTALERCPERFDRGDVCRLLGYEPNRGSLYRVLQELIAEKLFALEVRGEGTIPSKYRKL